MDSGFPGFNSQCFYLNELDSTVTEEYKRRFLIFLPQLEIKEPKIEKNISLYFPASNNIFFSSYPYNISFILFLLDTVELFFNFFLIYYSLYGVVYIVHIQN